MSASVVAIEPTPLMSCNTIQKPKPDTQADADASYEVDGGQASFDIARVDPEGTSVFAGRAEPGSQVTVTEDGTTVGTADVDENGEWTLASEHKFASADPKLGLRVTAPGEVKKRKADAAKVAAAEARTRLDAGQGEDRSAKGVTSRMLKNLEGLVDEARAKQNEERAGQQSESAPATTPSAVASTPSTPSTSAPETVTTGPSAAPASPAAPNTVIAEPATPQPGSTASSVTTAHLDPSVAASPANEPTAKSIPVPITFVFDQATFTDDGRKAASLLLEYLKLKRFAKVRLTGHADERGTDALNMSLSDDRLETVANFLRDGGFEGDLELVAKGEGEPFMGVDRSQYSQEDLWQLDRRVELVIAR